MKIQETYQCPKCQVQIDSSKITLKKLESHVRKCDSSKLVCIFCLKLYEQTEQVLFENHIQKHLIKQTLEQNSNTTPTTEQSSPPTRQQQQQHHNTTPNMSTLSTVNNNSI